MKPGILFVFITILAVPLAAVAEDQDVFDRLDTNDDNLISRDEIKDKSTRLFRRLLRTSDSDGDGKLTRDEFRKGMAAKPTPQPAPPTNHTSEKAIPIRQFVERFDGNRDGKLAQDELPQQMRGSFDRLDGNDDGIVDEDELKRLSESQQRDAGEKQQAPRATDRKQLERAGGQTMAVRLGALYQSLDGNKDGKISPEEIAAASESLAKLDQNKDGDITIGELLAQTRPLYMQVGGMSMQQLRELAQALDTNGDRVLSKDELPKSLQSSFDQFDTNGDGKIDGREVQPLLPRLAFLRKKQN